MTTQVPEPVKTDSRICFAIAFFETEADAEEYAKHVKGEYNGGFYHGRPTGRDSSWDHIDRDTGKQLYASTY